MKFEAVLPELSPQNATLGVEKMAVAGVTADSRKVSPGDIFVAVAGSAGNGHDHLQDAFDRGAALAVISDPQKFGLFPSVQVLDTRSALSRLAAWVAGDAAKKLKTVAITGTNGKTTTHWLVHHALNRLGCKNIRIGTIGVVADGINLPGVLTTPDPVSLHHILADALHHGIQSCVIEASSHALHQARLDHLLPDVGVFTNLTRDHLDYHQTMENYLAAKLRLFDLIARNSKSTKVGAVNLDSEYGLQVQRHIQKLGLRDLSFGRANSAAIRLGKFAEAQGSSRLILSFERKDFEIKTPLIGAHNAENLCSAFASIVGLNFTPEQAAQSLSDLEAAPGRLEYIPGDGFGVFVDYAHTPDALKRVLEAVRPTTKGKLWVVFGCGGDRDRGKRPEMGKVATSLADQVVVTSDNPRTEDPAKIIADITACGAKFAKVEPDRRAALRWIISNAKPGDSIIVAGKGHEDYQIIGTTKHHFSDQEEVRTAIRELRFERS